MKKTHKRKKPGHYCKICGERKVSLKSLQQFLRVFSGPGWSVAVDHNPGQIVFLPTADQPHVGLLGGFSSFFMEHLNDGFIRVDDIPFHQKFMHPVNERENITNGAGNHPVGKGGPIQHQAIRFISEIYRKENPLRDLSPEERLERRQKEVKPEVDAFFEFVHQFSLEDPLVSEKQLR